MRERPIADLVDALRPLGADIRYEIERRLSCRCVIGAGHAARRAGAHPRRRVEPVPHRAAAGAAALEARRDRRRRRRAHQQAVRRDHAQSHAALRHRRRARGGGASFTVPAGDGYQSPGTLAVEGDASGASYFLAAGAIGGGPVRVTGVGRDSIQGDVAFADVLARRSAPTCVFGTRLDRDARRRVACAAARSIATPFPTPR